MCYSAPDDNCVQRNLFKKVKFMKQICIPLLAIISMIIQATGMAQTDLEFLSVQRQTNREVRLHFNAPTRQICRLEVSTDLTSWQREVTWLPTKSPLTYIDPAAPFWEQRFYRLLSLSETNAPLGDHFLTAEGEVVVRQLSLATLLLAWQGKQIYIDPCPNNIGVTPDANFRGLPQADLILITHDHPDHLEQGAAPWFKGLLASHTQIICSVGAFNAYLGTQSSAYLKTNILRSLPAVTVLTNGAIAHVMGIDVEALPSYNITSLYHPRAANYNGYVITLGGKRLYFSGDTDAIPEMLALQDIDIAFIAIFGNPMTMNSTQAAEAVRQFNPKVVYPYHRSPGQETQFKQLLGTDAGIEVRISSW